jgi:hypothetical protein
VTADTACIANFVRTAFSVRGSAHPGGSVSPTVATVSSGGSVTLQATPSAGYNFTGYSGDSECTGTNPRLVISPVTRDVTCVASFGIIPRVTVTFAVNPAGAGSIATSGAPSGTCGTSSCTFNSGSSVRLTARPNAGYAFSRWSGCSTQTSPALDLNVVTSNRSCTALFVRTWQVTFEAEHPGIASANTGGLPCSGGVCTVIAGNSVTVSATTPTPAYYVDRWTCTETATGRVLISTATTDPLPFSISSVQNHWRCRASTQPFIQ